LTEPDPCFTVKPCISAGSRDTDPLTHYVIVRADLPFGVAAAQIIHAAGESSPGRLPRGTYAVALAARDEAELSAIEARLRRAGVRLKAIRESDPPYSGRLMALGLTPMPKSVLRQHLSSLPLLYGKRGEPTKHAA
jgi:hypothetical protein